METIMNSDSKVNPMTVSFIDKLGLISRSTNIDAQKIDGRYIQIYGMVSAEFVL